MEVIEIHKNSAGCPIYLLFSQYYKVWGSIHDHRLRLLPAVIQWCLPLLRIQVSNLKNDVIHPVAVPSLWRPRLAVALAGIHEAAAGISPTRRSPLECIYSIYYLVCKSIYFSGIFWS